MRRENSQHFRVFIFSLLLTLLGANSIQAQVLGEKTVPKTQVKALRGGSVETDTLFYQHQFTILSFWATWCKPCIAELSALSESIEDLKEDVDVQIIAISIDDSRNTSKIGPLSASKGWEFQIFTDENGDFKRGMNVNTVPHTFIVDKSGKILWQNTAYAPGDENILFDQLRSLQNGSIEN